MESFMLWVVRSILPSTVVCFRFATFYWMVSAYSGGSEIMSFLHHGFRSSVIFYFPTKTCRANDASRTFRLHFFLIILKMELNWWTHCKLPKRLRFIENKLSSMDCSMALPKRTLLSQQSFQRTNQPTNQGTNQDTNELSRNHRTIETMDEPDRTHYLWWHDDSMSDTWSSKRSTYTCDDNICAYAEAGGICFVFVLLVGDALCFSPSFQP